MRSQSAPNTCAQRTIKEFNYFLVEPALPKNGIKDRQHFVFWRRWSKRPCRTWLRSSTLSAQWVTGWGRLELFRPLQHPSGRGIVDTGTTTAWTTTARWQEGISRKISRLKNLCPTHFSLGCFWPEDSLIKKIVAETFFDRNIFSRKLSNQKPLQLKKPGPKFLSRKTFGRNNFGWKNFSWKKKMFAVLPLAVAFLMKPRPEGGCKEGGEECRHRSTPWSVHSPSPVPAPTTWPSDLLRSRQITQLAVPACPVIHALKELPSRNLENLIKSTNSSWGGVVTLQFTAILCCCVLFIDLISRLNWDQALNESIDVNGAVYSTTLHWGSFAPSCNYMAVGKSNQLNKHQNKLHWPVWLGPQVRRISAKTIADGLLFWELPRLCNRGWACVLLSQATIAHKGVKGAMAWSTKLPSKHREYNKI